MDSKQALVFFASMAGGFIGSLWGPRIIRWFRRKLRRKQAEETPGPTEWVRYSDDGASVTVHADVMRWLRKAGMSDEAIMSTLIRTSRAPADKRGT